MSHKELNACGQRLLLSIRIEILFGFLYSAPNSVVNYYTSIEDSISLAVDTGINDIVIAGYFNFNLLSSNSSHLIKAICQQFIEEPTHYTEHFGFHSYK